MSQREIKNLPESVRQRLHNEARETDRPFDEVLQFYAMERFLYRLSKSPYAEDFCLKGALLLSSLHGGSSRPTRDIDLLGSLDNGVEGIVTAVKEICAQPVEPDGISFDADTVVGEVIVEEAEYEGVRVRFRGSLTTAKVHMQIDVGFGDVVSPAPVDIEYPTILEFPSPRLRGYTRESTIAEKFETMVRRGIANTRLKDYYDIWKLSRQDDFDGSILATAISETFAQRDTQIPANPTALSSEFGEDSDKGVQWATVLKKLRLEDAPPVLSKVVNEIQEFLVPVSECLATGVDFTERWIAPGPWTR